MRRPTNPRCWPRSAVKDSSVSPTSAPACPTISPTRRCRPTRSARCCARRRPRTRTRSSLGARTSLPLPWRRRSRTRPASHCSTRPRWRRGMRSSCSESRPRRPPGGAACSSRFSHCVPAFIHYSGYMSTLIDDITLKIAARIRSERTARRWSLDDLAERSQVSKAMISKIERAEASPTAALLGRLSGAYGITLSTLLAEAESTRSGPVRHADQPVWRDPATGYLRRQVAAPGFPVELTQVDLPPGATVSFPAASYSFISQIIWVLAGRLTFVEGETAHGIGPGDSFELGAPVDRTFRNDTDAPCRYLV